jgi:hypothetical protein
MHLCAISRTLGKYLGYVAAPATGVSTAAAAGASRSVCNGGSHSNACTPDSANASPSGADHELP